VAEVYLKKEERIDAISMIMVLALLIYSIAEWMLRKRLKETGQTVLNQLKKPTARPTLKWVFQRFRNINEAFIELKVSIHREIINIDAEQEMIIKLFGPKCEKYYRGFRATSPSQYLYTKKTIKCYEFIYKFWAKTGI
jgi:hypothetical protein